MSRNKPLLNPLPRGSAETCVFAGLISWGYSKFVLFFRATQRGWAKSRQTRCPLWSPGRWTPSGESGTITVFRGATAAEGNSSCLIRPNSKNFLYPWWNPQCDSTLMRPKPSHYMWNNSCFSVDIESCLFSSISVIYPTWTESQARFISLRCRMSWGSGSPLRASSNTPFTFQKLSSGITLVKPKNGESTQLWSETRPVSLTDLSRLMNSLREYIREWLFWEEQSFAFSVGN